MTSKNTALLDMPSAELVKEAYGKAEELKLSFPEISALLRAAAGRIDVFNALLVLSSSVNVQRYSPDYQMHLNHEMAIMRPTDKGAFVSLADYVALMKERNEWERRAISNFQECAKMDEQVRALAEFKDKIRQSFHMGDAAEDFAIFINIENTLRRSDCLSAVEREFFTREVPDEDYPDEMGEECNLSWGKAPSTYVADFAVELREVGARAVESFASKIAGELEDAGGGSGDTDLYGEYANHLKSKGKSYVARIRAGEVQP